MIVTVTQTSIPTAIALSIRLPGEPWKYSRSPSRTCSVGITNGRPLTTKPTWQTSPRSRIDWISSRS